MLTILENYPLKQLNTFGINVRARYFVEIFSLDEIKEFFKDPVKNKLPLLILGGGSNILFTKNFDGVVMKINIRGKNIVNENSDYKYLKAGAGENWNDLVIFGIKNNLGGIENLSLIPGCVGAAPMQNIGAYGVELKDVFFELEAYMIETGEIKKFSAKMCHFGYRESIFKNELKGKCIIVSVTFELKKNHILNTSYGAIEEELKIMEVKKPDIQTVSEAVCRIRRSKLPDPAVIGNAGSFFKNPMVTLEHYRELKFKFKDLVAYPVGENENLKWKLAAGWLIEKAGWKGKRFNNFGVHEKQALVLANYGNANGQQILELSEKIMIDIKEKFGVDLEREVNVV